ncbi:MAG: PAC2 family protein [Desulfurococcales archaeon]|nr:PAC2 family protein [Desulfurococcales archaeon]MEB3780597.1 PAC2 family protein [Desulfurococcales archaeon]
MDIVIKKDVDFRGSVLITGFRGFGMVGYMVSKHIAFILEATKIGYIITDNLPPVVLVEEDGVGYPFEIYHSEKANVTIIVNRAIPEREDMSMYTRGIASWAREKKFKFAVLVGGLNRDFMPENEAFRYRWIANDYYEGPRLDAPVMEVGLGVMGPLAMLYMYLDYYRVPSIMILPYSVVEEVDYDASIRGIQVISEKLLGIKPDTSLLEEMALRQKEEVRRIMQMLSEEGKRESEEKGMYM